MKMINYLIGYPFLACSLLLSLACSGGGGGSNPAEENSQVSNSFNDESADSKADFESTALQGVWLLTSDADSEGSSLGLIEENQRSLISKVTRSASAQVRERVDSKTRSSIIFQLLPTENPKLMKWTLCSNEGGLLQSDVLTTINGFNELNGLLKGSNYYSFRLGIWAKLPRQQATELLSRISRETYSLLRAGYMPVELTADNQLLLDLSVLGQAEKLPLQILSDSELEFNGNFVLSSELIPGIPDMSFSGQVKGVKLDTSVGDPVGGLSYISNSTASSDPLFCFLSSEERGSVYYKGQFEPVPYSYNNIMATAENGGNAALFVREYASYNALESSNMRLHLIQEGNEVPLKLFDNRQSEIVTLNSSEDYEVYADYQGSYKGVSILPKTFLAEFSGEYYTSFGL